MSKYTITIKQLIDNEFDFKLTDYPIFDETYRNTLNQKILYHYYENEIGFETASLFRFYLRQKLNEIMPYYNILYNKQVSLLENIDKNVNLTELFSRTNSGTTSTSATGSSTSNSKNLFQDTPQGNISQEDIDAENVYATNLNLNRGSVSDSSSSSGSNSGNENYTKTINGSNGGKYNYEILEGIKNSVLNIDMMIINDLNELFMQIF